MKIKNKASNNPVISLIPAFIFPALSNNPETKNIKIIARSGPLWILIHLPRSETVPVASDMVIKKRRNRLIINQC